MDELWTNEMEADTIIHSLVLEMDTFGQAIILPSIFITFHEYSYLWIRKSRSISWSSRFIKDLLFFIEKELVEYCNILEYYLHSVHAYCKFSNSSLRFKRFPRREKDSNSCCARGPNEISL